MIRIREESCPKLRDDGQYTITIQYEPKEKHLNEAISKTLLFISQFLKEEFNQRISVEQDSVEIRKMMKLYLYNFLTYKLCVNPKNK